MGIFNIFKRARTEPKVRVVDDVLLQSLINGTDMDSQKAMEIPAVAACVNLICDVVSMIPVKFFEEKFENNRKKTVEIQDQRTFLINDDTKDTLDGVQFKRAIVRDYLLNGAAYAYINKYRNAVKSLHYADFGNVSIVKNTDVIFKDYDIYVLGRRYKPFNFLKILRQTADGSTGCGIVQGNGELLSVAYNMLMLEKNMVATGGNKRGFFNAKNRLSAESMQELRNAWNRLYSNGNQNMMILNDGLTFQEAGQSSVEMQLAENKKSTADSIKSVFGVPENFDYNLFVKTAVMPILTAIECSLNRDLLLEKEKGSFYFAFDTKEITKGDIKTRFEAYKTALDANLMQIDECRYMEDLEPLGLNFIKLGLQDVLYNPTTKRVYTPNTNQTANISVGGENFETKNEIGTAP